MSIFQSLTFVIKALYLVTLLPQTTESRKDLFLNHFFPDCAQNCIILNFHNMYELFSIMSLRIEGNSEMDSLVKANEEMQLGYKHLQ